MANLTNSHFLTDFQHNARHFIGSRNETQEPMLLTVSGKGQAVLVDPVPYRQTEERLERARLLAALREDVFAEIQAKHGF